MSQVKESFLFFIDNYTESIKELSYEEKGKIFDAIINAAGGIAEKPENLGLLKLAIDPIIIGIKRNNERYSKMCARNKKNGEKGGRPKNPEKPSGLSDNPNKPNGFNKNPKNPHGGIPDPDPDPDPDTTLSSEFEKFWEMYEKKQDRKKAFQKWKKLKQEDKDKIFETLPEYVKSTPDKKYRKNPVTYLNNESWNDEIVWRDEVQERPF